MAAVCVAVIVSQTHPVFAEPPPAPGIPSTPSIALQLNETLVHIFEVAAPSVVVIKVMADSSPGEGEAAPGSAPSWPGEETPGLEELPRNVENQGAGFIVSPEGYIYTNAHVVDGAERIRVTLKDGRQFEGKLVGADEQTDIAVVKISGSSLPVATMANSDAVRVGQLACAIGHPFDQEYSFTLGCVSGIARSNLTMVDYEEYIQTDASINPGNSGGPIINVDGHVIGMATLINGINRGLGFAIPINTVNQIGRELIQRGRVIRPYLGISMQAVSRLDDAQTRFPGIRRGVVVLTVHEGSPAFRSKLRADDVIVAIDGVPVSTGRELQKQVLSKPIGKNVTLDVLRDGKSMKISVLTAELPVPEDDPAVTPSRKPGTLPLVAGIKGETLPAEAARRMKISESGGVLVSSVEIGSPAAMAGLVTGDVIVAVDESHVTTPGELESALAPERLGRGVLIHFYRNNTRTFVILKSIR